MTNRRRKRDDRQSIKNTLLQTKHITENSANESYITEMDMG